MKKTYRFFVECDDYDNAALFALADILDDDKSYWNAFMKADKVYQREFHISNDWDNFPEWILENYADTKVQGPLQHGHCGTNLYDVSMTIDFDALFSRFAPAKVKVVKRRKVNVHKRSLVLA